MFTDFNGMKVGYAFCASFCTLERSFLQMKELVEKGADVYPIMSERTYNTDSRFTNAEEFRTRVARVTKKEIICTVEEAEPFGPAIPLDVLVIAPCTGNTLAKISLGISDGAVSMAAKAHLRADRVTVIALSSNDAMSRNLPSIARMLEHKAVYFLPMHQDDPTKKPHSLVAEYSRMNEAILAAMRGEQLRPLFM